MSSTLLRRIVLAILLCAFVACKKSSTSPTPPASSEPQVQTTTVTITAAGASPRNIAVAVGSRVLFINNDTRSHNMTSDPHPEHNDCPDINQVGFLSAGQSRETGNLVTARTCGFHDHDAPNTGSLTGQIVIR